MKVVNNPVRLCDYALMLPVGGFLVHAIVFHLVQKIELVSGIIYCELILFIGFGWLFPV